MSAPQLSPSETQLYRVVNAVRQLMQGRSNAAGSGSGGGHRFSDQDMRNA
jgi:hypothetical protein